MCTAVIKPAVPLSSNISLFVSFAPRAPRCILHSGCQTSLFSPFLLWFTHVRTAVFKPTVPISSTVCSTIPFSPIASRGILHSGCQTSLFSPFLFFRRIHKSSIFYISLKGVKKTPLIEYFLIIMAKKPLVNGHTQSSQRQSISRVLFFNKSLVCAQCI